MSYFHDYLAGDIVCLQKPDERPCPEDRENNRWAKVVSVNENDYQVTVDRDLNGSTKWQTDDIFLSHRPLELGKTYYIVGDHNITIWIIADREQAEGEDGIYGPSWFYEGKRSIAGGNFREGQPDFTSDICNGRWFTVESEARKKFAENMVDQIAEQERKLSNLKQAMLRESKLVLQLRKEGR